MTDHSPSRRSDAAFNRQRILEAARTAFAEAGEETSMAEIARRSGVGSATLYRNFATRRELLETLLVDEVDEVFFFQPLLILVFVLFTLAFVPGTLIRRV